MSGDVYCCEVAACTELGVEQRLTEGVLIAHDCLDHCIVPELRALWDKGVETLCSCCGHGQDEKAFIRVRAESAPIMDALGYERYEPHECDFYPGAPAYRAKGVEKERSKGQPTATRSVREIRLALARSAGLTERMIEEYV